MDADAGLSASSRRPPRPSLPPLTNQPLRPMPDSLHPSAAPDGSSPATGRGASVEVRRLGYSDLPQVVAIERRAFPTPWSLAMFVLELSKPSGICLAAVQEDHLVGYLVCSRYDNVWHLMNVAVDPDRLRRGIATALLDRLFVATNGGQGRFTLEVRPSPRPGTPLT